MKIIMITLLIFSFSFAKDIAIVKKISGEVTAKRAQKMVSLIIGQKIQEGDLIVTKSSSDIGMIFEDGTILALGENSVLSVDKYLFKPASNEFLVDMDMKKGTASFESGKIGKLSPESVKFRVPEGTIGIRGTKFYVEVK
ncbi:MAG: hypothetical protein DRG78_24580 [Epsilonproteobacteria bacterium]|nr:MAG: hypothetical protein DRG78_24580 [Campylobacterota bacterium]